MFVLKNHTVSCLSPSIIPPQRLTFLLAFLNFSNFDQVLFVIQSLLSSCTSHYVNISRFKMWQASYSKYPCSFPTRILFSILKNGESSQRILNPFIWQKNAFYLFTGMFNVEWKIIDTLQFFPLLNYNSYHFLLLNSLLFIFEALFLIFGERRQHRSFYFN